MITTLQSVEIGVGSALLGSLVGTVAGYALSKRQLDQIEKVHRAAAEAKAAISIHTQVLSAAKWVEELPATASLITNPRAQLRIPDALGEDWVRTAVLALVDISPALRTRVALKLSELSLVVSAASTARKYALTKLSAGSAFEEAAWDDRHAQDPVFVAVYELVTTSRGAFLNGLDELKDELQRLGRDYLKST